MIQLSSIKQDVINGVKEKYAEWTEEKREELLNDILYIMDNSSECYVFDKYYKEDEDDFVDITYFKYNAKVKMDEDGTADFYEYKYYFLEVHGIFEEDDYKEKVIIYANNNCDRGCCGTWEVLNIII